MNWLTLGKGRKEPVMSPLPTNTRGRRDEGVRCVEGKEEIEILLHALCASIHACRPWSLNSTRDCVICCFLRCFSCPVLSSGVVFIFGDWVVFPGPGSVNMGCGLVHGSSEKSYTTSP